MSTLSLDREVFRELQGRPLVVGESVEPDFWIEIPPTDLCCRLRVRAWNTKAGWVISFRLFQRQRWFLVEVADGLTFAQLAGVVLSIRAHEEAGLGRLLAAVEGGAS